jgi:hypothetical protein
MACFVQLFVIEALDGSIALGRDHGLFSCRKQRFDNALVRIESLVCQ